ncbi:DEAD/DEAH box helicase [archaeon]|nr:MAG: DEAD/DEAH box helicase [archaeon]
MSSKKSAGKGSSAPLQPPQEEKKPIAKGHRQRGAGTVVTAKPALVTKDGITLKPHEKLPFQLLHEYCQRNKRPSPKYNRAPKTAADRGLDEETFRVRVILEDAKNAKNNLSFCPVQAFSSELIAKDYAALLALFHLQRTIPLERTLPQPYSTVWLQLVSGNSESLSEAKEDDIQDDPNAVSINSTASVETITTVVIDEEQADWLCSQCGMPNTFLTLAKNVRKKCFKCQAVKDESAIAVGSSTKSAKINTSTVSGSAKVVKKIPPPVVLNLQATEQFASTAAQEQFEMQAKSNKNAILSYADAVWKTNPYYSLDGISAALADHVSKLVGFARPTKSTLPSSPPVAKSAVDTYVLSDFESDIERRLRQYGWEMSNKRCLHGVIDGALESVKRFPLPIEDQLTTLLVVLVSHYLLAQSIVDDEDVRNMLASSVATLLSSSTASGVRDSSVVEEEETMLAIYGTDVMDTFHVETELGYVHRVSMTYNSYSLHLFYSSTLPYPHTYPLIYLTGSNPTVSNKLVSMNSQLYKKMLSCSLGSPILFDLYAHLADIEDIEGSSMAIESDRVGAVLCTHCTAFGIAYNSDKMPTETSSTKEVKRLTISQANPVLEMQSRSFKKPRVKSVHPYWIRTSTASSYEVIFPVSTAQYQVMFRQRQGLPASRKRDLFIGMIQTKQVVIVTGETGCGKTTQIPQYLVEARGYCKVLVCQPRRLAAIGVAQRIADETSTSIGTAIIPILNRVLRFMLYSLYLGEQVGYMVKGEVKASRNTQILFCTYGVLLRVLQDDPMLQSVDYIILDEVHGKFFSHILLLVSVKTIVHVLLERGMDSDFSLALLMHALKRRGDSLKLVLMVSDLLISSLRTHLTQHLS